MTTLNHFDTVTLPQWAVCALAYGDESGLTDTESDMLAEWLEEMQDAADNRPLTFDFGEESFFSNSPEFGLATDCIELNIFVEA